MLLLTKSFKEMLPQKSPCLLITFLLRRFEFKSHLDLQFFFKKWANPGLFNCLFSVFSNKHHYKIYNQLIVKNVHPVYSAAIRTHDLWNMSLLPYPLDQGSLPRSIVLLRKTNETVAGIIPSGWPIFVMHSVGVRNRKIVGTDRSTTQSPQCR